MRVTLLAAFTVLFLDWCSAGQQSIAGSSARDQAIPGLRDSLIVALTHVRVIDGTGNAPREEQTLLLGSGKILAVGNTGQLAIPNEAKVVNLSGDTVLPGLVMLHEHLFMSMFLNQPDINKSGISHPEHFSFPRLYLAYGVTSIRTAGTEMPYMDLNLKRRIDSGKIPGPEIQLTSPYFSGEGDPSLGAMILRSPEDARRAVRYWAAEGFTSFKAYQWVQREILAALIDEAHRLNLQVTAHLRSVSCREAAEMGIDNIEHGCPAADNFVDLRDPNTQALFRTLIDKKVVLTLTPTNGRKPLTDFVRQLLDPSLRERLSNALASLPPAPPMFGGKDPRDLPYAHLLVAFVKSGGRLVLGSDSGAGLRIPGLADHEALENLVNLGFTPLDAIHIATLNGAAFLGIQNRTGSIQDGKEADLLIVKGNPAERIQDIENVEMIFNNGIPYDPKTLLEPVKGQVGWQ